MRKVIFCITLILASFSWADEPGGVQPLIVGCILLAAPIAFTDKSNSLGHAWELEGFSFTAGYISGKILGKKYWWMGPLCVLWADAMYRSGEKKAGNKFACDSLGVLTAVSMNLDWGI